MKIDEKILGKVRIVMKIDEESYNNWRQFGGKWGKLWENWGKFGETWGKLWR